MCGERECGREADRQRDEREERGDDTEGPRKVGGPLPLVLGLSAEGAYQT